MFWDDGVYEHTAFVFARGVPQDEVGRELVRKETVTETQVVRRETVSSYTVPSTYKVRLVPPPPTTFAFRRIGKSIVHRANPFAQSICNSHSHTLHIL